MTMHANPLALGRNQATADNVSMTDYGDCFRVDVRWNDGAHVYMIHDTRSDALAHIGSLGFV